MKIPSVAARSSGAAIRGTGPSSSEHRAVVTFEVPPGGPRWWAYGALCVAAIGLAACGDGAAPIAPDAPIEPIDAPIEPIDAPDARPDAPPTDPCEGCVALAACSVAAPTCACPAGYEGDGTTSGTGCQNIDECAAGTDTCVDGIASCHDTDGGFACACPAGYEGDGYTSGTGCQDIDECAAGSANCDFATCTNTPGTFTCTGIYGASPFKNMLVRIDPATMTPVDIYAFTLAGSTVNGINGLAKDPTTGTVYAIAKLSGSRRLCTVDITTGVLTPIGDLSDRFASIAFRGDGQLFGVTGNGAAVPETLYTIDKASAASTFVVTLGNGGDGEAIAYNPDDDHFYHWSGNGTPVFEKFPAMAPHTITDIPVTGSSGGEVFGALWRPTGLAGGEFVVSNIASGIAIATQAGAHTVVEGSTQPDDLRGLVEHVALPHRIEPATGTAAGGETVRIRGQGFQSWPIADVLWNGITTSVTVVDDTTLELTTPPGSAGPISVVLAHASGAQVRWDEQFTYVTTMTRRPDHDGDASDGGCSSSNAGASGGLLASTLLLGLGTAAGRRRRDGTAAT